jgi:hypothetical protein
MNPDPKEPKISFRSSPKEMKMFRLAADKLGFKHLSEFFRTAAYEKIRREENGK